MTPLDLSVLFAAAVLAGALNSVAGGGSFISFPALMQFGGVAPVAANATNTVALWPGAVASAAAYRRELAAQRRSLVGLGAVSVLGGIIGAVLLMITPERMFVRLVPWLLLGATVLFAFGGRVNRWVRDRAPRHERPRRPWASRAWVGALQLAISIYGGYFGGGIGMLMLALLAALGMEDVHAMNALKTLLSSCINGVAVAVFIWYGAVVWPQALLMVAGAILGGYAGARFALRLPPGVVRGFVLATGFAMSAYYFAK